MPCCTACSFTTSTRVETRGSTQVNRWERYWYTPHPVSWLLAPLGWLFCTVAFFRRLVYRTGLLRVQTLPVPVIVVGNISVGGTGKTPLVAWLVELLKSAGYSPGIISRGYGGRPGTEPQDVVPGSDPALAGDEPVLLARRCRCPVVIHPDRVAAARRLLARHACDIIISDDGLQHYRLGRTLEIAVIDGMRRFGNGRCLPAGPLRERPSRLRHVNWVVNNGGQARAGEVSMTLLLGEAHCLNKGEQSRPLRSFTTVPVHAVAGIGNPERFFAGLQAAGLSVTAHAFPDHHPYTAGDLQFADSAPVLMTEKDAVKCLAFAAPRYWYVPVDARLPPAFADALLASVKEKTYGQKTP